MKGFLLLLILLACICITGKIDYDTDVAMEAFRKEYAQNFHNCRAAAQEAK